MIRWPSCRPSIVIPSIVCCWPRRNRRDCWHGPDPKPFRDGLIAATALVHSLVVDTRNLADFEATGVGTPPTVLLLCLWAWRGLSVWRPCGRVLKSAASLRQVKVLWALGLLPYSIMSTADLDHNDKLAVEKRRSWSGSRRRFR